MKTFSVLILLAATFVSAPAASARQDVGVSRDRIGSERIKQDATSVRVIERDRPARRVVQIKEERRILRDTDSRRTVTRVRDLNSNQSPQFYSDGKTSVGLSFEF